MLKLILTMNIIVGHAFTFRLPIICTTTCSPFSIRDNHYFVINMYRYDVVQRPTWNKNIQLQINFEKAQVLMYTYLYFP